MIKLYEHQQESITYCKERNMPFYGLLYEAGCGKTGALINILRDKYRQEQRVLKTIIFCPLCIVTQWSDEWVKFGGEIYRDRVEILKGSEKDKVKLFTTSEKNIFVTNVDSLNQKNLMTEMYKWSPECQIYDESHQLKSHTAKRTKVAIRLAKLAKYRFILTGTPQTNGIEDLWSQFDILASGKIFPDNFFVFRAMYFYDKNARAKNRMGSKYFPDYQAREGAFEEIKEKIKPYCHIVKKKDCLDLPPFINVTREVSLSTEQEKVYLQMEHDLIAYLNDKACVAQMALTKAIRLQQIIAGIFKDDTGNITKIPNNRTKILAETLESIGQGHKIIIWSVFIDTYKDIEKVCTELGLKSVMLTGQQNNTEKQEAINSFKNDESVNVLISNQASGGTGLNLTEADYAIYYTRNFNLAHDIQSEARNYRSGSNIHKSITRIDLVAKGTIDEYILDALKKKSDLAQALLEYKNVRKL